MRRRTKLHVIGLLVLFVVFAWTLVPGQSPRTLAGGASSVAAPTPLTCQDVQALVSGHRVWRDVGPEQGTKLVNIEFIDAAQVRVRLAGEGTGVPDGTQVIFVTYTGAFVFSGPDGLVSERYPYGFEVYSIYGYLLLAGGLAAAPSAIPATPCATPTATASPIATASPTATSTP